MPDIEARVLIGWYSLASQSESVPNRCFYVKVAYLSYGDIIIVTKTTAWTPEECLFLRVREVKNPVKVTQLRAKTANCVLKSLGYSVQDRIFFFKHYAIPIKCFHLLAILPMWLLKMLSLTQFILLRKSYLLTMSIHTTGSFATERYHF